MFRFKNEAIYKRIDFLSKLERLKKQTILLSTEIKWANASIYHHMWIQCLVRQFIKKHFFWFWKGSNKLGVDCQNIFKYIFILKRAIDRYQLKGYRWVSVKITISSLFSRNNFVIKRHNVLQKNVTKNTIKMLSNAIKMLPNMLQILY